MINLIARVKRAFCKNKYRNKRNNVVFIELVRYDTESVMLRTDINIRLIIPHKELEKNYEIM